MRLAINLLGQPSINRASEEVYRFRSQKSWGLLALLILSERPPTRSRVAALLFGSADDPLRALRWSLNEIRRALGDDASVDGDPLALQLPPDTIIDVDLLARGRWTGAIPLPGLGHDLLESINIRSAPAFESWLLSQQRHFAAVSEAVLHEAALSSMARGESGAAIDFAVRAIGMNPLDENNQALLISLYMRIGDEDAARQQLASCTALFEDELGVAPGAAVAAAMREPIHTPVGSADEASVEAIIESSAAAVSAGAVEVGIRSVRAAVSLADGGGWNELRVTSRLVLAGALIHSLRGQDEEGSAVLHEADEIASSAAKHGLAARARAELGYVDYLRARYDRAEVWLDDALSLAAGEPGTTARATTYLGCVASDLGNYHQAETLLGEGTEQSRATGETRLEAYGLSMLGRVHLLREEFQEAATLLDASISLSEHSQWLAFLPWPQALRGEVEIAIGKPGSAYTMLGQAFARACQLGDPCWEGISARGLALTAEAEGDTDRAFEVLADAQHRCNRLADPYVWLEVYILDARCALGLRHGHPDTKAWVDSMHDLASRTGMKELLVRSLLHRSRLGADHDVTTARLLAEEIDNPALGRLFV